MGAVEEGQSSMRLAWEAGVPVFVLVAFVGSLLVCLGIAIGYWFGRRTRMTVDPNWFADQLSWLGRQEHIGGLASDICEYREIVHNLCERFRYFERDIHDETDVMVLGLLSQIAEVNEQLRERLDTAEDTLQDQAAEIDTYLTEARTDTLTGLANRRLFDEELERRMALWRRGSMTVSLILVDVDHFKQFNDRHGHLAGDAVLVDVGRVLQETTREGDLLARIGGEEFAIISAVASSDAFQDGVDALRRAVDEATYQYDGKPLRVTVSCGAAQATAGDWSSSLLKRADEALYASKAAGRNAAHWHDGANAHCVTAPSSLGHVAISAGSPA